MLPGRIAIVTGASAGIGPAISWALSSAGASVVLASDDPDAISALAAKIGSSSGHAVAVPTDFTSPVSVRRLIEQTLGAFGRLDVAVNNLASDAVALAMKYQIPPMARARFGHIVNLAVTAGVAELTRAAALDFPDSGVRIHAIPLAAAQESGGAAAALASALS